MQVTSFGSITSPPTVSKKAVDPYRNQTDTERYVEALWKAGLK